MLPNPSGLLLHVVTAIHHSDSLNFAATFTPSVLAVLFCLSLSPESIHPSPREHFQVVFLASCERFSSPEPGD